MDSKSRSLLLAGNLLEDYARRAEAGELKGLPEDYGETLADLWKSAREEYLDQQQEATQ